MLPQTGNNKVPSIALDLLGSDADSNILLESAIPIIESLREKVSLLLIGEEKNRKALESLPFISYIIAPEAVTMEDDPLTAVRRKKKSSLALGMRALKEKKVSAFISCSNTGALVASARIELGLLPHIKYPALLTLIPSSKGETAILDVGAGIMCDSACLVKFAAIGTAYQKTQGIKKPLVGLLNMGEEPTKGPLEFQEAHKILTSLSKTNSYSFYGNIEGRDAFKGVVDVIVINGFCGNIFLKTAEGLSLLFLEKYKHQNAENKDIFDPTKYPGALLCGMRGIVIKCHGNAHPQAIAQSINSAIKLIQENFIETIEKEISALFLEDSL